MLKNYIFMMSISITILSDKKLILFISDSVFENKYENKYDISDIRPYPIRLHPYFRERGSSIHFECCGA